MTDIPELTVQDNTIVSIHFTLTDSDGNTLDTSDGGPPLEYLHGAENVVPGLENALKGKVIGDHFQVAVPPEEGYGEIQDIPHQKVKREEFPDDIPLEVGMQFGIDNGEGGFFPVWLATFDDAMITLDFNHPLAGQTLNFDVKVEAIRNAKNDEIEQGQPQRASCCDDVQCCGDNPS